MTPHPHPSQPVHVPRRVVHRSIALLAAVLVIGGTPLVAQALDDGSAPPTSELGSSSAAQLERRLAEPVVPAITPVPDLGAELAAEPPSTDIASPATVSPDVVAEAVPQPAVDPVTALLTDTYAWDERGERVVALQEALGVNADGWYAHATHQAHRVRLDALGLSTEALPPAPALPAGTSPSEWAALRQCESNGNYSITNPSGKYRGAYQFDRPTWNSVAERHAPRLVGVDPAAASPADQDAMAFALYSERGARPWPQCGRHLS